MVWRIFFCEMIFRSPFWASFLCSLCLNRLFNSKRIFTFHVSVFMYLPIRAYAAPDVNWGDPESLSGFVAHITRASYGDLASFRIGGDVNSVAEKTSSGVGFLLGLTATALAVTAGLRRVFKGKYSQSLPFGTYVAMNGRCLRWDRVRKNRSTGVFEEPA